MTFELLVAGAFALATLRRYSLTKVVFFAHIVGWGLFLEVSSGTLRHDDNGNRWDTPCGSKGSNDSNNSNTTSTSTTPITPELDDFLQGKVRVQMLNVKEFLKNQSLKNLYAPVANETLRYTMYWLPKNQITWYCSEDVCQDKWMKEQKILLHLRESFQRFAITFELLKKFKLASHININKEQNSLREAFLNLTSNHIYSVLCEIEAALQFENTIEIPRSLSENIALEANWSEKGDLTTRLIQDWGVYKQLTCFLTEWMKIFNNSIFGLKKSKPKSDDCNSTANINWVSVTENCKAEILKKQRQRKSNVTKNKSKKRKIKKKLTNQSKRRNPIFRKSRRNGLRKRMRNRHKKTTPSTLQP